MGLLFILVILIETSIMMTIWDRTVIIKEMDKPGKNSN